MEKVSQEVYEQVKAEVLAEMEAKKLEKRRIDLAAQAVFAEARRKYFQKICDKWGKNIYGQYGVATMEACNKFESATKLALDLIGQKNARSAYLNGYAEDANKIAEQILEAILKD